MLPEDFGSKVIEFFLTTTFGDELPSWVKYIWLFWYLLLDNRGTTIGFKRYNLVYNVTNVTITQLDFIMTTMTTCKPL